MPANVAVRYSVEDQEVVRKSLEDFGEQGKAALKKMDDASKVPSSNMKALSNVVDEVKSRLVGLAVPLGPVGSGLIALGPGGVAAAAGIGAAITAMAKLNELASELATKSSRISNFSEQIGLSTDAVQAANQATVKYGKTSEETNAVIEKTAQAWDQLRKGQGTAFDEIRKIDPELLHQLATAKDMAGVLDILAQAYAKAGDEAAKIALARAFGGKGGASTLGALLSGIGEAGGLAGLTKEAKDAGSVVDKERIQRLSTLQAQIKDIKERTSDKFGALFSENVMQNNKEVAQDVERIVDGIKWLKENAPSGATFNAPAGQPRNPFIAETNSGFRKGSDTSDTISTGGFNLSGSNSNRGTRSGREGGLDNVPAPTGEVIPFPQSRPAAASAVPRNLAEDLRNMRDLIGLLGSAATADEQYKLKELELKKAVDDKSISQANAARALAAFKFAQDQATEGTRERLGIATQDNILQARLAQLTDARAKGIIKSDAEFTQAEQLVQREARQTAEAMEVRNSSFKGLKQLEIDGRDLSKSLDTGLTASLNGVENSLVDITTGTVNLSDGFKNAETAVIRSLTQMLIKMTVTAQLAKVLGATFNALGIGGGAGGITLGGPNGPTPFPSADGNIFSGGNVIPFADGGIVSRLSHFMMANGRPASMAENGEEAIMPLTRINGKLGVASAGGGGSAAPVVNVSVINNTGVVAQVSQSQGTNGDISVMLDKMVDGAVGKSLSSGSGRRVLGSQFGLKPFTGR